MTREYTPKGNTPLEKAISITTYQDAALQFMDMVENGDIEMNKVVLDRVEALAGQRPKNLKAALEIMLEYF